MTPPGSLSVLLVLCLAPTLSSQCPGPEAGHRGHYSPRQCSADLISQAVAASEVSACQPRPQVVRLPWPNNTEVHQMTPTHVEVSNIMTIMAQDIHVIMHYDSGVPVSGRLSLWPRSEVVCGSDLEAEVGPGDAGQVRTGGGAV